MRRLAKMVASAVAVLLLVMVSLATCNTPRIYDKDSNDMLTIGEYLLKRALDKRHQAQLSDFDTYSNPQIRVAFKHPSYLALETATQEDRGEDGQLRTVNLIYGASTNPELGMSVLLHRFPRLTSLPGWYPPNEGLLRVFAFNTLTDMRFEDNEQYKDQYWEASQKALISKIGGFPAAVYLVELDTLPGKVYLRGACAISPHYQVDLMVFGAVEPTSLVSVKKEYVDRVWLELSQSIILPE